jgi:hypothetical protein
MEDKRGTKRSHSSVSGSSPSSLGSTSTLPSSPSGSPPPPGSPPDVSSRWPPSPVRVHDGPSEEILVVDLCSDEEDAFSNTSRDEEFTRRLFGDLNRGLLGPPSDGNVLFLNDSDEEEEVREEITTDAEATPPSAVNSLTPTVSVIDANDASDGVQDDSSDGRTPNWVQNDSSDDGDEADLP